MKTSFYLAQTNAYNSLLVINGFRWISYDGDNKGFQDDLNLYGDSFIDDYKEKFIDTNDVQNFETLWNDVTTQCSGEFEDLDEFIEENFDSVLLIGEVEEN